MNNVQFTRLWQAFKLAERLHKKQKRKGSGLPYISHPFAVAFIVAIVKDSKNIEDILIGILLHDVVEDTGYPLWRIAKQFGPMAATIVSELSNDEAEIKRVGKLEYQKRKVLGISSYGLVGKLGDRLHNVSDNPTKQMVRDTLELVAFLKKNRKLSATHKRLVKAIEETCFAHMEKHGDA